MNNKEIIQQDMSDMSCEDIYKALRDRQISALMFHSQMADLFDFLGLMGFKRMHEYQYFSESAEGRGISRYYLNHHNKLLVGGHPQGPKVIPQEWGQYTRFDVTPQVRKQAVEKAFKEYQEWETETKELYSCYSKALMEKGLVADSNKICELVLDVDKELKCLNRLLIKLKAMSFDAIGIMDMQEELHEHYKEKTKSIGIDIC